MKKAKIVTIASLIGIIAGFLANQRFSESIVKKNKERLNMFENFFHILDQWMILREEGKSIERFFIDHQYKVIAVYGMGTMANHLICELENSSIDIKYGIDKKADTYYKDIEVFAINDNLPTVDAVIVTATFMYDEIEKQLKKVMKCPIISLDDAVFYLL